MGIRKLFFQIRTKAYREHSKDVLSNWLDELSITFERIFERGGMVFQAPLSNAGDGLFWKSPIGLSECVSFERGFGVVIQIVIVLCSKEA